MIISHAHRFIFLKTEKCAGTSVELALSQICGPDDVITRVAPADEQKRVGRGPQHETIPPGYRPRDWRVKRLLGLSPARSGTMYFNHMPAAALRRAMDPCVFDAYRKVTVVRNPWDQEVSLYYWLIRNERRPPSFERFVRSRGRRRKRKNFDIYSIDGRVVADVVLTYERLADDFSAFIAALGVGSAPQLPHAKAGHRPPEQRDYRALYDAETREIVARRHAREIEAFGYEF
jgi:hypothetical protein